MTTTPTHRRRIGAARPAMSPAYFLGRPSTLYLARYWRSKRR